MLPEKLHKKLENRKTNNAFRQLGERNNLVDFSSNDYLGFSKSETIFKCAHDYLIDNNSIQNGSTGSRLLSGNSTLYSTVETQICNYHHSEAALVFNSGYNANLGLLSCVPQRGDIIIYDELCHASIRDGIQMSNAKSYKFKHNDLEDLVYQLERSREVSGENEIYVITESVFSMDGDTPDLNRLIQLSKSYNVHLIIDEAHAIGVFGQGLVSESIFARVITFGKALGSHGAAVLGSKGLIDYLINFSRPFIYTTALSPHKLATIKFSYEALENTNNIEELHQNILFFNKEIERLKLSDAFIKSTSAIHCCIISGNDKVKQLSLQLKDKGFDVKPILSPTVPKEKERLRLCLHNYNSQKEISEVLSLIATFVNS